MQYPSRLFSQVDARSVLHPSTPLPSHDSRAWLAITSDLALARISNANLLIVGPDPMVLSLVSTLVSDRCRVAVIARANGKLLLPPASSQLSMAIIRQVDALTPEEQRRVLEWLRSETNRVQVVSTASASLLPMVDAGSFNDVLYYHLNTTYIDLRQ
jgi:hypothetical protein